MSLFPNSLFSKPVSRRTVLQLLGIGTVAGALSYSRFNKPKPVTYQPDRLILPQQLDQPKRVAVIGGGLAGLAAAYELSQRGFQVSLLERSPQLGGKIASWDIDVNGEPLRMEHGFHGFFPQYYNLWSLTDELGIRDNFVSLERYSVLYKDPRYQPEVFYPSHSAFPWNIVDLTISSGNRWRWGLNLASPAHWQVFRAITGFHLEKSYERLDNISVADWAKDDFPRGLYDLYFLPFGKSTLNSPDVLSAGELMQFFHFYFFGNPEGLAFNGTRQDMGRSLVDPIAAAITANGGQVLTDVDVSQVQWQDGQITGLRYRQTGSASPIPFWIERHAVLNDRPTATPAVSSPDAAPSDAPQTSAAPAYEYFGAGDDVYVAKPGAKEAVSLTCTHQGCTVAARPDGTFRCPCHGARFDRDGKVLEGPADRDLARYRVRDRQGDRVQLAAVNADTTPDSRLEADYFVFAADVRGVRHLFDLAEGDVNPTVAAQVQQLAIADPFAVARFWFDRDFDWEHSEFTSLSGYRLTDSITRYHKIQADYQAWHERTGGSVVELHAYCYKEAEFPTQEDVLAAFEAELYEIVPALQEATLLHREVVNQKNFSGFPPGSYANRPATASGVPNLTFAGDWVKMPFPCGLMERAVSSGFLAANEICSQEGLQRRDLYTVPPEGLLQI